VAGFPTPVEAWGFSFVVWSVVMATVDADTLAAARRIESAILQSLARVGLEPVAAACQVDATTVGRWREKEIPRLALMLALAGMKTVPVSMRCYRPETIDALHALASERLNAIRRPSEELVWEDSPDA
jgi:hypothetical protein